MSDAAEPDILVISEPIAEKRLRELAAEYFGDMVKAVVDTRRRRVAFGGELHADEEFALLKQGSQQNDLWGINIYFDKPKFERIEFDSMINIRPRLNNRSRYVENEETRKTIVDIVESLIL